MSTRTLLCASLLLSAGCQSESLHRVAEQRPASDRSGGDNDDDGDEPESTCEVPGACDDGPILEYRFEDVGDVLANTGSFAGGDGTRFGATFLTDVQPGAGTASALAFDGIDDWVRVPDHFHMTSNGTWSGTPLAALTVEAWIRADEQASQRVVWDDYGNPGVLLAVWDGRIQFALSTEEHPGMGIGLYSGIVEPHEWHHVAGVYDGRELRTYLDGHDTCERAMTTGAIQDNSAIAGGGVAIGIGADNETIPALNFSGAIDELRIHGRALTPHELAAGYAFAGEDRDCQTTTTRERGGTIAADGGNRAGSVGRPAGL